MTEDEARQLREAYAKLEEEAIQKDRNRGIEGLLMSALLRIEELERQLAKDSHNSSKPLSSDGFKHEGKKHLTSSKATWSASLTRLLVDRRAGSPAMGAADA